MLAITRPDQVHVVDIEDPTTPIVALSAARTVISVAWSPFDKDVVATGAVDGSLDVWTLSRPQRPLRRWLVVRAWDLSETLASLKSFSLGSESDSDDEAIFGEPEWLRKPSFPIAQIRLECLPRQIQWLGEYGVFVLTEGGTHVRFFSFGSDWEMLQEVWKLKLDCSAVTATVRVVGGTTVLTAVCDDGLESHRIPSIILDSVGGHVQSPLQPVATSTPSPRTRMNEATINLASTAPTSLSMRSASIARLRGERRSFEVTSKQLQNRRRKENKARKQQAKLDAVGSPHSHITSPPTAPSLELPRPRTASAESPMPFLSPSIPARKLPGMVPAIDDCFRELPLEQTTSLNSMHSASGRDSDSDDETLAEGMVGSGSFLPGGINVPLPKTSGATFTSNGQLLSFFPLKSRPQTTRRTLGSDNVVETEHQSKATKVARLFQTFGNLVSDDGTCDSDSGSDISRDHVREPIEGLPSFALQPSSFDSRHVWRPNTLRVDATPAPQADVQIIISAYDVSDLLPFRYDVAQDYRILRKDGESGSKLCQHNADIASNAGSNDTADVWRLLALLLDDKVPLQALLQGNEGDGILTVARKAMPIFHDDAELGSDTAPSSDIFGKLRWADHPVAASWLTRQTLLWAEERADTQMLAYVSVILAQASETVPAKHPTVYQSTIAALATCDTSYRPHFDGRPSSRRSRFARVLRSDSCPDGDIYHSPEKHRVLSQVSSRHASEPHTGRLDLAPSTSPVSFPSLSRQSSKLSTPASGTASPEQHRSSFGAAAKYYAQSISDKFASYGTSPPVKRFGISPGANELSTSIPTASSSWNKSVSFASAAASGASGARDSQHSQSYTDLTDEYDSDKTIDDNSLPRTPKSTDALVMPKFYNADAFSDEATGIAKASLMPADLAANAVIWQKYYAEQLRCWGLWLQAAELEKANGLSDRQRETALPSDGVVPVPDRTKRNATCSICYLVIGFVEQLCPACLHTAHLSCLQDYLENLDDAYECPTGCGCACADLSFEELELVGPETELDVKSTATKARMKKASFADSW
ncbi:hypothetical protein B0A50_07739 [Salinomyces thailandicus]|uniref:WDR59/RTC1-like RING zinc finger domain-containing protein n=1 Tax=Salinomyces thailandicus TaxID=706561 RepID=A0A4V5N3A9_9PEZI|nr:hypothetical protein B0A50_07739 [Salinomyces thailandica]